jgi:hypothetical protein
MRHASLFLGSALIGISSLACANGPAAASASSGVHAAAPSVSAGSGSRAESSTSRSAHPAGALALGGEGGNAFAVKAMAVSQMMVAGEPATVLKVTTHAPLTAQQERALKRLGYERYVDKWTNPQLPAVYYCRRAEGAAGGATRECYSFATATKAEPLDPKNPTQKAGPSEEAAPVASGPAEDG